MTLGRNRSRRTRHALAIEQLLVQTTGGLFRVLSCSVSEVLSHFRHSFHAFNVSRTLYLSHFRPRTRAFFRHFFFRPSLPPCRAGCVFHAMTRWSSFKSPEEAAYSSYIFGFQCPRHFHDISDDSPHLFPNFRLCPHPLYTPPQSSHQDPLSLAIPQWSRIPYLIAYKVKKPIGFSKATTRGRPSVT